MYTINGKLMEDIIIVLGQYLSDDGTLSLQCRERCFCAYNLYKEGKGNKFLLSGGTVNKKVGLSEAQAMKNYLLMMGVEENRFILEEKSVNTYENARYSAEILKTLSYNKLILVSSSDHIYRWYYNPVRFFKWFFKLKIEYVNCMDSLVEILQPFKAEKESFLFIVKSRKELNNSILQSSEKNIFVKIKNTGIRQGIIKRKFRNSDIDMISEHIKDLYFLEKLEVIEK